MGEEKDALNRKKEKAKHISMAPNPGSWKGG